MMDLKLYKRPLAALTLTGDRARVTPGVLAKFGGALSAVNVNIYCVSSGEYSLTFYVDEKDHEVAKKALQEVVEKHSAFVSLSLLKNIGMITVTGPEFIDSPGMLLGLIEPVSRAGINILSVSTSFDSVIMFVDWGDTKKAYELIEKRFLKGL